MVIDVQETEIKYNVQTLAEATNYCSDWKFYFSRQEALYEMELKELEWSIKSTFDRWSKNDLTLDQLRRIMNIINEKEIILPIEQELNRETIWLCPNCKEEVGDCCNVDNFCRNCGQKIDFN